MGGWIGKVGKDPYEYWSECMFGTGNVPVRSAKVPVRRFPESVEAKKSGKHGSLRITSDYFGSVGIGAWRTSLTIPT